MMSGWKQASASLHYLCPCRRQILTRQVRPLAVVIGLSERLINSESVVVIGLGVVHRDRS